VVTDAIDLGRPMTARWIRRPVMKNAAVSSCGKPRGSQTQITRETLNASDIVSDIVAQKSANSGKGPQSMVKAKST